MKVGDLVRWINQHGSQPVAIVVESSSPESKYHHRIRVKWIDSNIPIQASAVSVDGKSISSWVKPEKFEIISSLSQ